MRRPAPPRCSISIRAEPGTCRRSPHSMTTAPCRASSSSPRSGSPVSRSIRYRSTWASCKWPGYTRTSWNVGLATGAADPAPRATPRTKVVLPAPNSPVSRTTSPVRRRLPKCSPSVSVAAAELVTTSSKVVVAGLLELHRLAAGAEHLDRFVVGEEAERPQAGAEDQLFGPNADQLRLLAAGEGFFQCRAVRDRNLCSPNDGAATREGDELVQLAKQPVRDVAAAQPGLVKPAALIQQRNKPDRAPLPQRRRGGAKRAGHRDGPSGPSFAACQRSLCSAADNRDREHSRSIGRAHVAARNQHLRLLRQLRDTGVDTGQAFDGPLVGKRDRGQRPPWGRALGCEVAQGQRKRAPPGILRAHPAQVEMHAFDEHVAARDDETIRIFQHSRVVLSSVRRQIWLDPFEQLELTEAFDFHY